jgi:NAD+ kinase
MELRRVSFLVHEGKPQAVLLEKELTKWLTDRGISVVDEQPDMVISLGGDGTVLRAAREAHAVDAPLLAINMGTLGYLTEVDAGSEHDALKRISTGDFEIEERMMLACTSVATGTELVGLNEALVERSSRYRLVRLDVRINNERLAKFNADGVIVATPTGSTAYALSAGGPIVSPRTQCLLVVPVSPHMFFSRPFVLSPDDTVEITVGGDPEEEGQRPQDASLVLDGALGASLSSGDRVIVKRHERPLRLVRLSGPGFLERLRIKLGLPS